MPEYIATFFTHYDAILFQRALREHGILSLLTPVPRQLSSSCGTCARFSADRLPEGLSTDSCEQLVRVADGGYILLIDHR